MKKIIIDLDGTLTLANTSDYKVVLPRMDVIEALKFYKENGFEIVIFTARNMRTFEGNVGKRLHIGFNDPSEAIGTTDFIRSEFERVRNEIKNEFTRFYITEIKKQELPKCACNR